MTSWMNAQDTLLQYGLVASVAATVLPLGACLLARMGRARSAVYHHMVWFWCLVGIAILPQLWLYAPKITLAILPTGSGSVEAPAVPVAAPALTPLPSFAGEGSHVPIAAEPLPFLPEGPGVPWQTVMVVLWVSGTTFMLLRLAAGAWQLRRIRRCAQPAELPADCMPTGGAVRLLLSDAVTGPVCFGLLHPAILLPRHMHRQASLHELRMILRHELAHIHRRDGWTNLLQRVLEAVLFFHPGVWLTSRQLTQQRELICDNWVLADGVAPDDYARILAQVAEAALAPRLQAAALFEGRLLQRVRSLLDPTRTRRTRVSRSVAAMCLCAAVLSFAGLGIVRLDAKSTPASSAGDAPETGSLVTGTVVDEAGKPLKGAIVQTLGPKPESAVCDRVGGFILRVRRENLRHQNLLVSTPDRTRQAIHEFDGMSLDSVVRDLRISARPSVPFRVRVADASGVAVASADVEVFHQYTPAVQARTNAAGIASFLLPADIKAMWVIARKSGVGFDYFENYKSWPGTVDQPLPAEVSLVLNGARTVRVHAVDSAGQPVAGASFVPWYFQKPGRLSDVNLSSDGLTAATSGPDGIVVFDWLPVDLTKGTEFLVSRDSFHCPKAPRLKENDETADLSAVLLRNTPISGRVLLPDGRPAKGILLQAEGRGATNHYFRGQTRTAGDGTWSFSVFPDQSYLVSVIDDEYAAKSLSGLIVRENQPQTGLDIQLIRGTRIHGTIVMGPNSAPATRQTVGFMQQGASLPEQLQEYPGGGRSQEELARWTSTGPDGRYQLRVGPGRYEFGTGDEKRETLVVEDQAEIVRDFHLPRPVRGRLDGAVVDAAGAPVAGALVQGQPIMDYETRGHEGFDATTDAVGRFTVQRRLDPMLLYAYSKDGRLAGYARITPDDTVATIRVNPAGSASGRVLDGAGQPLVNQQVTYEIKPDIKQTAYAYIRTQTDSSGRYHVSGLAVGALCSVQTYQRDPNLHASRFFWVKAGDEVAAPDLVLGNSPTTQASTTQPSIAEAEPEQAEEATGDWPKAFYRVYRLEDGQAIKRIAPPFIPQRLQYYQEKNPGQAIAIPSGPDVMYFHWNGQLRDQGMMFGDGKPKLRQVMSFLGFQRYEYDGPDELLKLVVTGDWIVRDNSSQQERTAALGQILRTALKEPIHFERQTVEREVIVVRGTYGFRASDDVRPSDRRSVNIYADTTDPTEGSGGGSGTFPRMLAWIGDRLNMPVIDETDAAAPARVSWRNHQSSRLSDLPDGPSKWAKVDLVLAHLAQQTSLQFTRERRPIAVWFIQPGEPAAP